IRLKKKRTLYTLIASLAASPLIFYLAVEINQLLLLILAALVLLPFTLYILAPSDSDIATEENQTKERIFQELIKSIYPSLSYKPYRSLHAKEIERLKIFSTAGNPVSVESQDTIEGKISDKYGKVKGEYFWGFVSITFTDRNGNQQQLFRGSVWRYTYRSGGTIEKIYLVPKGESVDNLTQIPLESAQGISALRNRFSLYASNKFFAFLMLKKEIVTLIEELSKRYPGPIYLIYIERNLYFFLPHNECATLFLSRPYSATELKALANELLDLLAAGESLAQAR
ncbi:MAG: hypothetical protein K6347_05110, partial [Campylobacterales bacterium]